MTDRRDEVSRESRWEQLQRVTRDLSQRLRTRAVMGRLRAEVSRLESRLESEKVKIGKALYPLVEDATITVELAEVQEGVESIARLRDEIERRRTRIEKLATGAAPEPPARGDGERTG